MFNTSSCRGNRWNPCWDYMSGRWKQSDYYWRKQKYTVTTQAVVGTDLIFLDIATGFLGSVHDARVLRSTSLFAQAERRDILDSPQELINGLLVRPSILGDVAYPPTTLQVKTYSFNLNLSDPEKSFNKHLSSASVTVKRVFGVLKGRWTCLLKRLDNDNYNLLCAS